MFRDTFLLAIAIAIDVVSLQLLYYNLGHSFKAYVR